MKNKKISKIEIFYFFPGIFLCICFIFISSLDSTQGRIYTLHDDIMISMSYAKTFANTGELIWYEGSNRVQGFTNFLYTIFLSFLHLFNFNPVMNSLFVSVLNVFIIFAISLKVSSISMILSNGNKKISYFLGGLIPFQYPLLFWSLRGYEVGIISLLLILIIEQIIKYDPSLKDSSKTIIFKIYTLLLIGVLIRIDFIVVLIGISLYFLMYKVSNFTEFINLIKYNIFVSFFVILLLLFQYIYYGDFLPNTFYLKTGGFSLIEKIPRGFLSLFNLLPLIIFAFSLFISKPYLKDNKKHLNSIFFVSFFLIIYNIYIGGDAWEVYKFANRFITPIIPLVFLLIPLFDYENISKKNKLFNFILFGILSISVFLVQLNVKKLLGLQTIGLYLNQHEIFYLIAVFFFIIYIKSKHTSQYLLAILFTLFLSYSHIQNMFTNGVQVTWVDNLNVVIGKKINQVAKPDAVIGLFWAGNLSYYIDRPVIDFLGKSDRFIAKNPPVREITESRYNFSDFHPGHNKWNFQYSISNLSPDIIIRTWKGKEFFEQIETNQYKKYCIEVESDTGMVDFPIYIKYNSQNINFHRVFSCNK